jgi:fatty-acyl-CoA synthase
MTRGEDLYEAPEGLLRIDDCLDADGGVAMPPGTTLISLIERNVTNVGDTVAYRYLDFAASEGEAVEWTWSYLDVRLRAVGARIQQTVDPGQRVAILAPQGLDYVAGFYAAVKSGCVAVPLFAPELPGHAERLEVALLDARPDLILTTAAALGAVARFLAKLVGPQPQILVLDDIADEAAAGFAPVEIGMDDVSHLQYTSGATRKPVAVEITHRAVGTNLVQMILSIDLLNRNTHGVSWLPLYHDMGLSMIGFPAVYGGHSTLMSPTAFVRRPQRWIQALSAGSREGRVVTAAPNFAYEWAAQRGAPAPGEDIDLANVVMIIGSEPVSMTAITAFNEVFGKHGLPPAAIKPSYGIAEATLFVATTPPGQPARASWFDGAELAAGRATVVGPSTAGAVAQVSCGQVARSVVAVIVDPDTAAELPDRQVGEIWLRGGNVGRGYWGRPEETRRVFHAHLAATSTGSSRAHGVAPEASWLRTGDLGMYVDGELFVTGRIVDHLRIAGRNFYPQDIETAAADASPVVRRGYVAAITAPGPAGNDQLVIVAERATGTSRSDPNEAIEAIRAAVLQRFEVTPADILLLPAGAIPRTTSGKLARRACRSHYLAGSLPGARR